MRADLDRYHTLDCQGLQRLVVAASLALTNSAAYEEIRQLYQALQTAQDTASAALARTLHDEIINGCVRLNVASLKKIAREHQHDELHDVVQPVLEREQQLMYDLRRISEVLHPLGIDDPLGLPMVLRLEVDRQDQTWEGQCQMEIVGSPVPLEPRIQREALRIAREAITNAIKHADATIIAVDLQYSSEAQVPAKLTIRDNGRNARNIAPRIGHRGLRYLQESAHSAGGRLSIEVRSGHGTTVNFTFPVANTAIEHVEEQGNNEFAKASALLVN